MKILQICNKVPYPTKDGGAIACMNLAKGFAHMGHDVTILAMNTAKHNVSLEEIPENIKELANFELVDVPAKIRPLGAFVNLLFSTSPYNAVRFINKVFAKRLVDLLNKETYDIIQLEGLYVCPYIPLIRENTNAPVVYRAHNIEYEIWERTASIARGFKGWYLGNLSKRIKKFEKSLLNTYDLLVPITKRDGIILDKLGNKKSIHVSQTGIDTAALIPNAKNLEYPSVFHIGSMEWAPNQEGLVWFVENCWETIRKKYPELKLHIAGRNAPDWLKKVLQKENIVFHGEVSDAYEFMNSKAIMVVPLFSGSGMRIKIIEGMALGKSIVTTPIGTEGIDTSNKKDILLGATPGEFVEAISLLIEDKAFFEALGKNAIEFIHENFDNLAAASKLIEFYKQNT